MSDTNNSNRKKSATETPDTGNSDTENSYKAALRFWQYAE